tara:strand:- start:1209 stop:2339 length:1131 start_codon:yes stop_codon:yes gene_type:complete
MENIFFKLFQYFLHILDRLFPKRNNLLLFPVKDKTDYRDNLRFFYEAAQKSSELECLIICLKNESWEEENVIFLKTWKGILSWLNARFLVIHHGLSDLPYYSSIDFKRRKVINLWHGITLKKLGYKAKNQKITKENCEYENYLSILCSSKLDSLAMQSSFKLPRSRVWLTGLPRNDLLMLEEEKLPLDLKKQNTWIKQKIQGRMMILYMPTWREDENKEPSFDKKQLELLKSILKKNNACLCFKKHPNSKRLSFEGDEFLNLSKSPCNEIGIMLRNAKILVTDYSSAWTDFILLDKPIVSYCYDLDSYEKERGLFYKCENVFPGKVSKTFDSFIVELEKAINGHIYEKHEIIKRIFHKYTDGKNSERVVAKVIDSI